MPHISDRDQIKLILESLGPQDETDLSFLTSNHASDYINKLDLTEELAGNPASVNPPISQMFEELSHASSKKGKEMVKILENSLNLNPYFRMSAGECLKNKVFDVVRD